MLEARRWIRPIKILVSSSKWSEKSTRFKSNFGSNFDISTSSYSSSSSRCFFLLLRLLLLFVFSSSLWLQENTTRRWERAHRRLSIYSIGGWCSTIPQISDKRQSMAIVLPEGSSTRRTHESVDEAAVFESKKLVDHHRRKQSGKCRGSWEATPTTQNHTPAWPKHEFGHQ